MKDNVSHKSQIEYRQYNHKYTEEFRILLTIQDLILIFKLNERDQNNLKLEGPNWDCVPRFYDTSCDQEMVLGSSRSLDMGDFLHYAQPLLMNKGFNSALLGKVGYNPYFSCDPEQILKDKGGWGAKTWFSSVYLCFRREVEIPPKDIDKIRVS
jgi:hypothetical protein